MKECLLAPQRVPSVLRKMPGTRLAVALQSNKDGV